MCFLSHLASSSATFLTYSKQCFQVCRASPNETNPPIYLILFLLAVPLKTYLNFSWICLARVLMCALLFFIFFLSSVFQACVVDCAWVPGPAFVSAQGRNLMWDLFSYPVSFFEHFPPPLLFFFFFVCLFALFCFCFVFSNSPGSLGHFFEAGDAATRLHSCAGAHTLFVFTHRAFPKKNLL